MAKGGNGLFSTVLLGGLVFLFSGCAQIEELGYQVDVLKTNNFDLLARIAQQEEELKEKDGQIQSLTEKGMELEGQNADCRQELESQGVAYQKMMESKEAELQTHLDAQDAAHGQELTDIQGDFTDIQGDLASCQEKLAAETIRGSGIKVIFFKGDILYEVSSQGYADFRAALRYRSLGDTVFLEKLRRFEEGNGGDYEVLAVMNEMDLSRDRIIDHSEARAFRKKEEVNFSSVDQARAFRKKEEVNFFSVEVVEDERPNVGQM